MAQVQGQPDFNLPELIDLALCSPEVGAVNFNILRIFLHELLRKFGYGEEPAQLNDVEAHQIQNFKNYIQGQASASPMPGVLRYATGHQFVAQTPRSAKSGSRLSSIVIPQQDGSVPAKPVTADQQVSPKGFVGDTNKNVVSGPKGAQIGSHAQPLTGRDGTGGGSGSAAAKSELESKVARLERHLEALYALPTNQQILGDKESAPAGMSVNDMWQIIQLNNRVAAAEAAIQKMASLIEDLAREMKTVKADAFNSRKESQKVDPATEICAEKCDKAQTDIMNLTRELQNVKNQLQQELNRLQNATGVDPSKVPSFMKLPPIGPPAPGAPVAQVAPAVRDPNQNQVKKPTAPPPQSQGQGQGKLQPGVPLRATQSHTGIPSQPSSTRIEHTLQQQPGQPGQNVTQTATTKQPGTAGASSSKTVITTNGGQGGQQGQGQGQGGKPGAGMPQKLQPHPGGPAQQQQGSPRGQGQGQGQGQQGKPGGGGQQGQGQSGGQNGPSTGQNGPQLPTGQNQGQEFGPSTQTGQNQLTTDPGTTVTGGAGAALTNAGGEGTAGINQEFTGQPPPIQSGPGDGKSDAQAGSNQPSVGEPEKQRVTSAEKPRPAGSGGSHGTGPADQGQGHEHGHRHEHKHHHVHGISEHHPEARPHHDHIPVDVTNKPLTGVIHQEHTKPFHDYKGPGACHEPAPAPAHHPVVPIEYDVKGFIPPFSPTTDTDKPYQVDPCAGQTELVQKELQLQYAKLQGMQRQMAMEIQEKMEFVYQKLLREIEAQHLTTSPYMTVGAAADKCLGPGICAGHGMPADTAVCQFPHATTVEQHAVPCAGPGHVVGVPCQTGPESATATAPGVCPGKNVCPACKNDILHHLRGSPRDGPITDYGLDHRMDRPAGYSASNENLLRQGNNSMILLPRDLEELRDKVKAQGHIPDIFDEIEVLEKLATLWEAVNVLKLNEESIALRLVKQDAVLKNVEQKKPSEESSGKSSDGTTSGKVKSKSKVSGEGLSGLEQVNDEDIQTIFTNLTNLVIENAALKEKQERFHDSLRDFEDIMVTKPMLVDAMSDKADKGAMITKVSYDEFGTAVEELTNKLSSLLLEVYQKNETWKQAIDKMGEELTEKLDKAEIGPLRAYFKSHLNQMQEQVAHLTKVIDEPDPAGTRKKLLKDYNCISCDRHTAISGVTNCPTLPMLGPMLAGHTTASVRAFELHRMRNPCSKYDPEGRDFNLMEKQNKQGWPDRSRGSSAASGRQASINDEDVMNLVNRYVGGSHTVVTNTDRVATFNKRPSTVKNYPTHANASPGANEEIEGEMGMDAPPPPPPARPQTVATAYHYDQEEEFTYEE